MAYAYCHKCDAGLDQPTFAECMLMKIECHHCGHDHELEHDEASQALIELEERITKIEQHLGLT
jgi:Zn ribbon nucleic-acid-binding protein